MQTGYQYCATLTIAVWHCVRTEAPGQESRAFTSLTAPSWALISDSLMLSGSQTVQSGVQRKETEASQRETNTQWRFWVLEETTCMTNATTLQSAQEHHWLWALMRFLKASRVPSNKLWRPAVWRHEKKHMRCRCLRCRLKWERRFQAAESRPVSFSLDRTPFTRALQRHATTFALGEVTFGTTASPSSFCPPRPTWAPRAEKLVPLSVWLTQAV